MSEADFLEWFAKWKDVVTTGVAIIAIFAVVWQITQASRFEKFRIRREQVAARATMPLTLSALSDYGREMLLALAPLERWLEEGGTGIPPEFEGRIVPNDLVLAVEKVVRAYPDDNAARALAAVMSEVQVLDSRSKSFGDGPSGLRSWSISMKDNLLMAAGIVARCEDLFEFARFGVEFGEPTRSHLQQVLNREHIHENNFPRVWEATQRFDSDPELNREQRRLFDKVPDLFKSDTP